MPMETLKTFEEIFGKGDEKLVSFSSKLISTKYPIKGISIPTLSKKSKSYAKEFGVFKPVKKEELSHEETIFWGLTIGKAQLSFEEFQREMFEFLPFVDNWATCDTVSTSFKKQRDEKYFNFYSDLLKSPHEFFVRVGVVSLFANFKKRYLEIISLYKCVKRDEYYIEMAIAWGLANFLVVDFQKVVNSLSGFSKEIVFKTAKKGIESLRISQDQKEILKIIRKNKGELK